MSVSCQNLSVSYILKLQVGVCKQDKLTTHALLFLKKYTCKLLYDVFKLERNTKQSII